jgi:hypothetical protein
MSVIARLQQSRCKNAESRIPLSLRGNEMEMPHRYPYNPSLRFILLSFGYGFLWIAVDWLRWDTIPPTGFRFWHSLIGLIPIAVAFIVGVRRIWVERYLLLDDDSMVLPIGLFQMRTAKIEYTDIRRVWRHYTTFYAVPILQVATEKQTFDIVSTFLSDNESYCALEEFLTRKVLENECAKSPRN